MSEPLALPAPLADVVADFEFLDRGARAEMLIDYADRFEPVPPEVATPPYPELNRAPRCESEAYVFATDRPDGTLGLWFAVESPQGLSAKAWATILDETLSGQPLELVARVPQEVIFRIFGRDLSMGKGQGLIGMLDLVQHEARRRLEQRRRADAGA
ncbi:MAG TPA: SufE family protein [Candidatus Eisenbacteria bacterium]|jgi:cysteine desulfuration protein SufE